MRSSKPFVRRAASLSLPLVVLVAGWLVQTAPAPAQTAPPSTLPATQARGLGGVLQPTTTQAAPAPAATPAAPAKPSSNVDLEQRMTALHFDVGAADGVLDEATSHGIMALQKTYDMPRTGQLDEAVLTKVGENPAPPAPIVPGGEPNRVEIDLNRQVLYFYEGGSLSKILSVSSGNGERFCSEGRCRNAVTPTGAFKVSRENDRGWESGPLGDLYKPQYFNGGIALHGSKSVPAGPASHGCVRIPMPSADWMAAAVTAGTPVYVAG